MFLKNNHFYRKYLFFKITKNKNYQCYSHTFRFRSQLQVFWISVPNLMKISWLIVKISFKKPCRWPNFSLTFSPPFWHIYIIYSDFEWKWRLVLLTKSNISRDLLKISQNGFQCIKIQPFFYKKSVTVYQHVKKRVLTKFQVTLPP